MVPSPDLEFERELGRGAYGSVHLARLRAPWAGLERGATVAVKRLDPRSSPELRAAFEREARAGAEVEHPALVRVLGRGESPAGLYLVMRYAPGRTLRERLADQDRLPEEDLRRVGAQVAGALAALHAAGWCHGDVKPENVRDDDSGPAVLVDLGFAQRIDERGLPVRSGSLPYLAPEQARGGRPNPAGDVFALGVLLHEAATGQHPYPPSGGLGSLADRWMQAIQRGGDVHPSRISPRLSPLLDALLSSALAHDPEARPSAAEIADALERGEDAEWWRGRSKRAPSRAGLGRRGELPFAGRARELEALEEAWSRAARGDGGVIWVEAAPGLGRSRLVEVAAHRARGGPDAPLVLRERCLRDEQERGALPVRVLLRQYLHLGRHSPPGPRERALLEALVPAPVVESLVARLSADPDAATPLAETTALARWLVALGRARPTLVFLDDLDYASESTLDLLSRVSEELAGTRLLLVLGWRGDTPEVDGRIARRRAALAERAHRRIVLGPLDEKDTLEIVLATFGEDTPRRRLAAVLHERSAGVPGVLGELISGLREKRRVLTRSDGRLELLIPPERVDAPASVTRAVSERLARLPRQEREWIDRFAILGGHLERHLLARAYPDAPAGEIDGALATLRASGWLVPFGDRERFASAPVREAVLDSIPPERRRALHAEVAEALGRVAGTSPGTSMVLERARHLRAAARPAEVLEVLEPQVRELRATNRPANDLTLCRWALEAIDALPQDSEREAKRARLLEIAADAADRLGAREEQRRFLDRLTDRPLDPELEPAAVARVYLLHGQYASSVGQYGLSRNWLRNAMDLAARAGDRDLEALATLRLAYVEGHVGRLDAAERLARSSLERAAGTAPRGRALLALATVAVVRDEFERALRLIERSVHAFRSASDANPPQSDLAEAALLRSRTYRLVGRPRRAFASVHHVRRLAAEAGERRLEVEAGARLGRLLLDLDRPREAELELREARIASRELEYPRGEVLASLFLGTLLAEEDDPEGAQVLARTSSLARELGLSRVEALADALRARVALRGSDVAQADELSSGAHALFEIASGELADRIVVAATRELVLSRAGRRTEARSVATGLDRRLRRVNERIQSPILRQRHHRAMSRLLAACRTPEGPVYPRLAQRGLA